MRLIRPPQRLHRQMPPARPIPEVAGIETELELELGSKPTDETERSVMRRILTCDRIAWEAAERCAALRREENALVRAQLSNGEPGTASHDELLAGILRAQLERNRERIESAEQSYRSATALLRDTITDALERRMAPAVLARRIETLEEPEASGM